MGIGWDNDCIGVGMGLGYVFGDTSSSTPISVLYEYVPVLRVLLCVEYIHRMDMKFIS